MNDLSAAIAEFKPEIAALYERIVRNRFSRMVEVHGADLKGISNSWEFARAWNNTVRAHVRQIGADRSGRGGVYEIDEEQLAKSAAHYADAVAAEWELKIRGKLGEMDNATVERMDGCRFFLHGAKAGKAIRIEQTMILNVSSKGTLFNQFPARIYVNGKFTSEAAFKKMAA
jgi:hypothetical protein